MLLEQQTVKGVPPPLSAADKRQSPDNLGRYRPGDGSRGAYVANFTN